MKERRLVWRVLRHWREIANGGRFPRRDEIESWMRGEDGVNCLLIAVESPIELSHFLAVGMNLGVALPNRHAGRPALVAFGAGGGGASRPDDRGRGDASRHSIRYRAVLLPLSEDGIAIDHVFGAANYRSLRADEARTTQIIFRRLPMAPPNVSN